MQKNLQVRMPLEPDFKGSLRFLFSLSFRFLNIFNYLALSEALYMQMIGRLIQ